MLRSVISVFAGVCLAGMCVADTDYDLVIYGATPAGIAAALSYTKLTNDQAAILLLEPTSYIGGMASPGGIGLRDHRDDSILNSTALDWGLRNGKHYNVSTPVCRCLP